jgi:hypothetical protein
MRFGQHERAACPVRPGYGGTGLSGLGNLGPARKPQDMHRLRLKPCWPGKFHPLTRFQLAERLGPSSARQGTLGQTVQPAKALTWGYARFGQNGNSAGLGGKRVKVGGDKLDRKWLRHGILRVWEKDSGRLGGDPPGGYNRALAKARYKFSPSGISDRLAPTSCRGRAGRV